MVSTSTRFPIGGQRVIRFGRYKAYWNRHLLFFAADIRGVTARVARAFGCAPEAETKRIGLPGIELTRCAISIRARYNLPQRCGHAPDARPDDRRLAGPHTP